MPIPDGICRTELLALVHAYDKYMEEAREEDKFATGWRPVCIDEFYDNEFMELIYGDNS